MIDKQPECGTLKAYWQHIKRREVTDQACRDAHADYERARRAAKPREVREAREASPCGTVRAYARHVRRREPACAACRAARTDANRLDRAVARIMPHLTASANRPETGI